MLTALALVAAIAGSVAHENRAHHRVRVVHRHRVYHDVIRGYATAYGPSSCDPTSGGGQTAAGPAPYFGEVANDQLAPWTKIEVSPPIRGRRDFVVLDHFGSGQPVGHIDVFMADCGGSWPNPPETIRTYTERVDVFYRRAGA